MSRFGHLGGVYGWGHPIDPPAVQLAKRAVEQAEHALESAIVQPVRQQAEQSVQAAEHFAQSTIASLIANPDSSLLGIPTSAALEAVALQAALKQLVAA